MTRLGIHRLAVLSFLGWTLAAVSHAQQLLEPTDARAQLASAARLIAGVPPTHPAHADIARGKAWQAHSAEMQARWSRIRDVQAAAMTAWRDATLPKGCPAGRTLLYPFSGPDFFNAYQLFPDCETYVMFGLERIGEMPPIDRMGEREHAQLLVDVRNAMTNLFQRNYFVTDTMSKQLHTERLRGVVPVLAVSMALSGLDVLSVEPLKLSPVSGAADEQGTAANEAGAKRGARRRLEGVTVEFRSSGALRTQKVHYFSLDATDTGLAAYPEFLEYLGGFAPSAMLLKSASYLLHGNEFRRLRGVLLDTAVFLVQDDTGLPYSMLVKRGWQVEVFGRYERPIKPFEYAYQPDLAKAYAARKPEALPFLFGYRYNTDGDRAHVMVGRLDPQAARSGMSVQGASASAVRP